MIIVKTLVVTDFDLQVKVSDMGRISVSAAVAFKRYSSQHRSICLALKENSYERTTGISHSRTPLVQPARLVISDGLRSSTTNIDTSVLSVAEVLQFTYSTHLWTEVPGTRYCLFRA